MKKKIWIIDDDPMIGNILSEHLRGSFGFDPYYFSSAKDAYNTLKTIIPDIILLDWVMPQHDGMDLIDALKKKPQTANIPVFMVTGKTSGAAFESACSKGVNGYFTKPIDYFKLSKRLNYFFKNNIQNA